jgi:hypothetical protein
MRGHGCCAVLAFLALAITGCDSSGTVAGAPDASSDGLSSLDATADGGADPCAEAGAPPSTLACTGLYANFATKELASNAMAYAPATPLWSDGAQKARWIELPPNTQIDSTNPNEWTFPVGTKLFKEFRVGGKRVETRMFVKTSSSFWNRGTYVWNADDSAAPLSDGTRKAVPVGGTGDTWTVPSDQDCDECHRGRQDHILGFEQVGLGLPGAQGLTLAQLVAAGLLTHAPASLSLTIGDDGTGLDSLALGWIHVNCGVTCHNANQSAAGAGAGMLLRLDPSQLDGSPPKAATWDVLKTTLGVPCVSGSVSGQPRIAPGDPQDSVIYQLMDERGTLQMPPIGSQVVDEPDVAVVRAWIATMAQPDGGAGDGGGQGTPDAGGGEASAQPEGGSPTDDGGDTGDDGGDAGTQGG